jgi:hypothetical protein
MIRFCRQDQIDPATTMLGIVFSLLSVMLDRKSVRTDRTVKGSSASGLLYATRLGRPELGFVEGNETNSKHLS